MSAPPTDAERDAATLDDRAEHLLRELAPQVLGAVVRRFRDFAACRGRGAGGADRGGHAVAARGRARQPARLADPGRRAAHDRSRAQRDGAPAPRGRSWSAWCRRDEQLALAADGDDAGRARTTRSILLFMCCHPALTPPSAIALTLRAVGGLTTAEIASAFLVPEATMAQRISRAKQTHQGVRRAVPACPRDDERAERLGAVLHVLYLIFNEGYAEQRRPEPAAHRSVERGDPPDPRAPPAAARRRRGRGPAGADAADRRAARGAHRARRRADPARRAGPHAVGPRGDRRGRRARHRDARRAGRSAPYQLQAAIAAVHDEAPRAEDTDWPQILALYGAADADVRQPDGGAQPRDRGGDGARPRGRARAARRARRPTTRLAGHHRLDAVRAHLLERAGDRDGARSPTTARGRAHHEPARAELPERDSRSHSCSPSAWCFGGRRNRSLNGGAQEGAMATLTERDVLNGLIETCHDAERGFLNAAVFVADDAMQDHSRSWRPSAPSSRWTWRHMRSGSADPARKRTARPPRCGIDDGCRLRTASPWATPLWWPKSTAAMPRRSALITTRAKSRRC